MPAELQSTSHGQTLVLTLSNPDLHNALEPAICAAGIEALNGAERSPEVHSIIITGAAGIFSTGGTPQRLLSSRLPDAQAQSIDSLHNWIETIRAYPKPVIAAVEGGAVDSGFSLALACDLIVAARSALFSIDCSRMALSPDGGASWSLAHAMPRPLATELLLCGTGISAERLQGLGVVNRLTEPGSALVAALELAEELNTRAPNALTSAKELLCEAQHQTLAFHLGTERSHFIKNLHHANADEGIRAFMEKRPPRYR